MPLSKGYITAFKCFGSYVIINRLLVPLMSDTIHKCANKIFIYRTKICEGPRFSWNATKDGFKRRSAQVRRVSRRLSICP